MFFVPWISVSQRLLLPLAFALSLCGSVAAQVTGAGDTPPASADVPPPVEPPKPPVQVVEKGPVTHYLEDSEGNLQSVIDMKFEDFVRLWNLERKLVRPDQPDRYSIQQWAATGRIRESWVELDVTLKLDIMVKHWCRVPLGMSKAVLTEDVQHEGPGRFVLGVDADTGDYVCWFRDGEGDTHTLKLKVHAPLEQVLGESRLRLRVPRSATSRLTLLVKSAQVTAVAGATEVPAQTRDDGTTEVNLIGLNESVQVSWRKGKVSPPRATTVLEARGVVVVRVEGLDAITTEAQLQVKSSNGPLKSFRVRLPADVTPIVAKQPGYVISRVNGPSRRPNGGARTTMVEVRLTQPTSDPVEVKLGARQELGKVRANSPVEIGLLEVVDAVRQSGVIALQVTGEATVDWFAGEGVVRVDTWPPAVPRENTVAGFEYSQQPCSLKLKVLPEETWISVEPQYLVHVGADVVRLQAQLNYHVRGPKTDGVEVSLAGWQLDAVEPAALVKLDALQPDQLSPLVIHLAEATNGPFKLDVRAHRVTRPLPKPIVWPKLLGSAFGDLAIAAELLWRNRQAHPAGVEQPPVVPLAFPLPRPAADEVKPAAVVLLPDDNVHLMPVPGASRGLKGDPNPPPVELPDRAQAPLFYEAVLDDVRPLFVGNLEVLKRRVSVEQETGVSLQDQVAHVTQQLRYYIAHEGLDYLLLHVPPDLPRKEGFLLECDGSIVEPDLLRIEETPNGTTQRLPLAGPRIGSCEVKVTYTVPVEPSDPANPAKLALPLVVPIADGPPARETTRPWINRLLDLFIGKSPDDRSDTSFLDRLAAWFAEDPAVARPVESLVYRGHTLSVGVTSPMQIEPPGDPWVELDGVTGEAVGQRQFFAETPADEVVLGLAVREPRKAGAAIATRAWVQTWLNADGRRDRASFRVRTGGKPVQVRLPAGADTSKVQLFVDGVPLPWPDADRREMTVLLAGEVDSREHLVELFYTFEPGRSPPGGMTLELPQVAGVDWVKRLYWQVVLPGGEELVAAPAGLTPEAIWGWHGVRWGNRPRLDTKDLEMWMDTSRSSQVPAGASEYLFSSFGPVEKVALRTTNRSLILLMASGIVLVGGLVWVYVPLVRRAWLVLPAVVVFAFFALAYPEPAIFVAQAAVLGLALAIVARHLYWIVIERRVAKGVVHGTAFFTADRSTTQTQPRRMEGSSHGGSATVPAVPAAPPPESGS
jgi:hypothetical protein